MGKIKLIRTVFYAYRKVHIIQHKVYPGEQVVAPRIVYLECVHGKASYVGNIRVRMKIYL